MGSGNDDFCSKPSLQTLFRLGNNIEFVIHGLFSRTRYVFCGLWGVAFEVLSDVGHVNDGVVKNQLQKNDEAVDITFQLTNHPKLQ